MFELIGYNYFSDGDALSPASASVTGLSTTKIENAVFDHLNVTRDTNLTFTTTKPEWTYNTTLDCDFANNINAGNVSFLIEQISAIKIKRRVKGTFDWLMLTEFSIETVEDLSFVFNDLLNANLVEYEYALVPVLNGAEGNYIIDSIFSQFNGVFIGDAETTYKFMYDVDYGTNARNQQIGTFEPLGNRYPIIVANGELSYNTGTVTATLLNDDFEENGLIDRQAIVQKKEILKSFLTNRQAKIIRDWNSNIWLCMITDSPKFTYKNGSGMGIPQVGFSWTEIGKADNQQDLYNNGLLPTLG